MYWQQHKIKHEALKQFYKYGLLNAMAKFEQVGVDALKLITTSWDNITKKAIIRCWLKADILGEGLTRRMEELVGGDDSWVGSLLKV